MANPATLKTMLDGVAAMYDGGGFTATSRITKAQVVRWINEELSKLDDILATKFQAHRASRATVTLVAGTDSYALPVDFYRLLATFLVESGRRYRLGRFELAELGALNAPLRGGTNKNLRYMLHGDELWFAPTPQSGSVEVWYRAQLTPMAMAQASAAIGSGANGTVTITVDQGGSEGNTWTVTVVVAATPSQPLSVALATKAITVTLGTDGAGAPDATKNTATLVAAAVTALAGVTAVASGTGVSALTGAAPLKAFTGGDDGEASAINTAFATGWEAFAIAGAAAKCMLREQEDPTPALQAQASVAVVIDRAAGARDEGGAHRIVDVRGALAYYSDYDLADEGWL